MTIKDTSKVLSAAMSMCVAQHPTDIVAQQQCIAKTSVEAANYAGADAVAPKADMTKWVLLGGAALSVVLLMLAFRR